jgi:hypothetical protein
MLAFTSCCDCMHANLHRVLSPAISRNFRSVFVPRQAFLATTLGHHLHPTSRKSSRDRTIVRMSQPSDKIVAKMLVQTTLSGIKKCKVWWCLLELLYCIAATYIRLERGCFRIIHPCQQAQQIPKVSVMCPTHLQK